MPFVLGLRRSLGVAFLLVTARLGMGQAVMSQEAYAHLVSGNEFPLSAIPDGSGHLYVAGNTDTELMVEKFDAKLEPIWQTVWDSPADLSSNTMAMTLTPSGSIVVAALIQNPQLHTNTVSVLTFNGGTGAVTSVTTPLGANASDAASATFDSAGYLYVVGYGTVGSVTGDFVAKIDPASGSVLWNKPILSSGKPINAYLTLAISPTGIPCLYGSSQEIVQTSYDSALAVFEMNPANGATLWGYQQPLPAGYGVGSQANGVTFDAAGDPIAVGFYTPGGDNYGEGTAVKLNASTGAPVWSYVGNVGNSENDVFTCATVDPSGNVLLGGQAYSGDISAVAAKLAGNSGNPIWYTYSGNTTNINSGAAITCDSTGNAYLQYTDWTYLANDVQGPTHLDVEMLSASNGTQVWDTHYAGSSAGSDSPLTVFLANGALYAVGGSFTSAARGLDFLVQELVPTTGAVSYQAVIDYSTHAVDRTTVTARGPDGSLVEAGESQSSVYQISPIVTKFGPTGAVLWSNVFPSNYYYQQSVLGLTVAPDGSVYFAIADAGGDLHVYKFAKSTGAVIWQITYTADEKGNPNIAAMCAAPNGDLVVALSTNAEVTPVFPVVRFASATGAVLWVAAPNYGGTYNSMRISSAVALSDGSVVLGGVNFQNDTDQKALLFKIDEDGSIGWNAQESLGSNYGGVVVGQAGGDVFYLGPTASYALRVNGSTGAIKWYQVYSTVETVETIVPTLDSGGDIYFAGQVLGPGTPNYGISLNRISATTGALSTVGARFGLGVTSTPASITLDGGGAVEVLVQDSLPNTQSSTYSVFKIDNAGLVQWDVPYSYPGSLTAYGQSLWESASGDVAVAGSISFRVDQGGHGQQSMSVIARQTTGTVTFTAAVTLEDLVGSPTQVPMIVQIRNAGSTQALLTRVVYPSKTGTIKFEANIPDGKYDVTVQGLHYLRQKIANVAVTSGSVTGLSYRLVNGDVNGDNVINESDLTALMAAFGSKPGAWNWNPNADLNGDGVVNVFDEVILKKNFGQKGSN